MTVSNAQGVVVPAQTLPILDEADVVVVGGGTSGYVAAVAAARTGARTILVERNGFLGGSATGTYNTNLSSSYDSNGDRIMGGIAWEVIERLVASGGALFREVKKGVRTPAQIFPEATKAVALEMVHQAGVILYLHTWASDVFLEDGRLKGLIVQNKSGRQVILGHTFVDCSADADVVHFANAPYEQLDREDSWITTLDLTVANIDARRALSWALEVEGRISGAVPQIDDNSGLKPMVQFVVKGPPGEYLPDGSFYREHRNLSVKMLIHRSICRVQGHVSIDATDVRQLTWAEYDCRRQAMADFQYLKENVPGFEDAFIVGQSPLGVRETRRTIGEYVITIDDILRQARFDDVVGLNSRAIDMHMANDRFSIKMLEGNHDIPLRALIPRGTQNLLVAGRCISSDHESNASLRGGGTCMITGHAAGTTAALAAKTDIAVPELDVRTVQQALIEQDAVLRIDQAVP